MEDEVHMQRTKHFFLSPLSGPVRARKLGLPARTPHRAAPVVQTTLLVGVRRSTLGGPRWLLRSACADQHKPEDGQDQHNWQAG